MTNIEFILTRMMHDPVFAEDVLENPEAALAEYNLPLELVERFKTISRPAFSAMTLESRKSFAQWVDHPAE